MKKLLIAFIAISFLACNNESETSTASKVKYNEIAAEMLKGDIASYTETTYKTDSTGKIGEMDSCCAADVRIDENGNYIGWTEKDIKGKITNDYTYTRYDDGLFKGYKNTKGGKSLEGLETQTNDKGEYTGAQEFDSTGKLAYYYTNITANEYGQVTAWKQYDKDSVFRETGEGKYDKTLQTSFVIKDSVGKIKSSYAYKYNDKGEQIENSATTVTKDSTTTKVTKYTYDTHDDMGNWTQRTEWDDKGKAVKIIKRVYTYRPKEEKK